MSLYNATSMDGLTKEDQAAKALLHLLKRIRDDAHLGYFAGVGTETFALATEAFASLTAQSVTTVRKNYTPISPRRPEEINQETMRELSMVDMRFVAEMERELVANQGKGDWRSWQPDSYAITAEITHHFRKLRRAMAINDAARVTEYAADVANNAMKAAERFGNLEGK
jgi:hypothetical protein